VVDSNAGWGKSWVPGCHGAWKIHGGAFYFLCTINVKGDKYCMASKFLGWLLDLKSLSTPALMPRVTDLR
jgi:hypothetical protein